MRFSLTAFALAMLAGSWQRATPHRPLDPITAPKAAIDRFSAKAAHLQLRTPDNHLPAPNAPVDFDHGPFVTRGFGPHGERVAYYNFDVQPLTPAPLYVLYRQGEGAPVKGQLPIIDALPGDSGYNDFHIVVRVTVPSGYASNSIASAADLRSAGYPTERTTAINNLPIVPEGSTAKLRLPGGSAALGTAWFDRHTARFFTFAEHALSGQAVPVSPIFVAFNVNPGAPGGGPASGFKTEPGSDQTHNVLATLPTNAGYSPLWQVSVYDNGAFDQVHDLESLHQARVVGPNVATVNCPVVSEQPAHPMDAMHH